MARGASGVDGSPLAQELCQLQDYSAFYEHFVNRVQIGSSSRRATQILCYPQVAGRTGVRGFAGGAVMETKTADGPAKKTEEFRLVVPQVAQPKGGGAIHGIGEKYSTNAVTGTAAFNVPLAISPGRGATTPQVSLTYDSGA